MGFSLFGSSGKKSAQQTTTTTTTSGAFDVTALGGDANVTQIGSGATVTGLTGRDLQGLYDYAADGMQTLADFASGAYNTGVGAVTDLAKGVTDLTERAFDKSTETTVAALQQVQEAWRRSQNAQVNVQETLAPYVKVMALIAAVAVVGVLAMKGKK